MCDREYHCKRHTGKRLRLLLVVERETVGASCLAGRNREHAPQAEVAIATEGETRSVRESNVTKLHERGSGHESEISVQIQFVVWLLPFNHLRPYRSPFTNAASGVLLLPMIL